MVKKFTFSKYIVKKTYFEEFEIYQGPFIKDKIIDFNKCMIINSLYNSKNIFLSFKNIVTYSLVEKNKEEFLVIFNYLQKIHNAFKKLARAFLFKKSKLYNTISLYGDNIQETSKYNITIKENGFKYLFSIYELKHIILNSLLYHEEFIIESQHIKNPYTNLPFQIYNLYNIYLYFIKKNIIINEFFLKFVKCHFNIHFFRIEYEPLIKEQIIIIEYNSLKDHQKISYIKNMIETYLDFEDVIIPLNRKLLYFDKNNIVYKYMYTQYGNNFIKRRAYKKNIRAFFENFKKNNPYYGRKQYVKNPETNKYYVTYDFNVRSI